MKVNIVAPPSWYSFALTSSSLAPSTFANDSSAFSFTNMTHNLALQQQLTCYCHVLLSESFLVELSQKLAQLKNYFFSRFQGNLICLNLYLLLCIIDLGIDTFLLFLTISFTLFRYCLFSLDFLILQQFVHLKISVYLYQGLYGPSHPNLCSVEALGLRLALQFYSFTCIYSSALEKAYGLTPIHLQIWLQFICFLQFFQIFQDLVEFYKGVLLWL